MKRVLSDVFAHDLIIRDKIRALPYCVLNAMKGRWGNPFEESESMIRSLRLYACSEEEIELLGAHLPLCQDSVKKIERYVELARPCPGSLSEELQRLIAKGKTVELEDGSLFVPTEEDRNEARDALVTQTNVLRMEDYEEVLEKPVMPSHFLTDTEKDRIRAAPEKEEFRYRYNKVVGIRAGNEALTSVIKHVKEVVPNASLDLGEGVRDIKGFTNRLVHELRAPSIVSAEVYDRAKMSLVRALLSLPVPNPADVQDDVEVFLAAAKLSSPTEDVFKGQVGLKLHEIYDRKLPPRHVVPPPPLPLPVGSVLPLDGTVVSYDEVRLPHGTALVCTVSTTRTEHNTVEGPNRQYDELRYLLDKFHADMFRVMGESFPLGWFDRRPDHKDISRLHEVICVHLNNVMSSIREKDAAFASAISLILEKARASVGVHGPTDKIVYSSDDYVEVANRVNAAIRYPEHPMTYTFRMLRSLYPWKSNFSKFQIPELDHRLSLAKQRQEFALLKELALCLPLTPTDVLRLVFDTVRMVDQYEEGALRTLHNTSPQTYADKGVVSTVKYKEGGSNEDIRIFLLSSKTILETIENSFAASKMIYFLVAEPNARMKITQRRPSFFLSTCEQISQVRCVDLMSGPEARNTVKRFKFAHDDSTHTVFRVEPSLLGAGRYYFNTCVRGKECYKRFTIGSPKLFEPTKEDYWGIEILGKRSAESKELDEYLRDFQRGDAL